MLPDSKENSEPYTDSLLEDIRRHQIKLQSQNEELFKSQQELARTRRKYVDLFEQAPTSHLILDRFGRITNANLEAKSAFQLHTLKGRLLISLIATHDHQKFTTAFICFLYEVIKVKHALYFTVNRFIRFVF